MPRVEYLPVIAPPISYTWKPQDGETIVPVVKNVKADIIAAFPSLGAELAVNGYLTELRATATLNSIDLARPLTTSPGVNTNAEILADTLETQWESARVHLGVWTSNKENPVIPTDWDLHGFLSMQNSAYYPYEFHDAKRILTQNLAYEIGAPGWIGLSVMSVQFGGKLLMLDDTDRLTFRGSFRQEVHAVQPDILPQPTIIQGQISQISQRYEERRFNVLAASRTTLMEARTARINGVIANQTTSSLLYVREGGFVTSSDFTYSIAGGNSRPITPGYNGIITAISASGQILVATQETYNVPIT